MSPFLVLVYYSYLKNGLLQSHFGKKVLTYVYKLLLIDKRHWRLDWICNPDISISYAIELPNLMDHG